MSITKSLRVYDPAMCCSTGVCGPSVDTKLVELAGDLAFLKRNGVQIERFNLGHDPEAFAASAVVMAEMGPEAENLPIFVVGEELKSKGTYPTRTELARWFGIEAADRQVESLHQLKVVDGRKRT